MLRVVHVMLGVKWRWQLRVSCYYFWRHVLEVSSMFERKTDQQIKFLVSRRPAQ